MNTKLHINISQGVVDVEGDPELVREIYSDFKDMLLNKIVVSPPAATHEDTDGEPATKQKVKRRSTKRKRVTSEDTTNGISADSPKLDKYLDTAKLGDFFGRFEPKNNAEKILIYLKFITEELGISAPNTDQVFTCFKSSGEKIPKAFAQAFYDTSSKQGFIDFGSATEISITIAGENHFNHNIKRIAAE